MSSDTTLPAAARRPVILVIEEDPARRATLWEGLADAYDMRFVDSRETAEAELQRGDVSLVIVDDVSSDATRAFDLRERVASLAPSVPVMLMVASGDEELAVDALRRGFADFIVKRTDRLRSDLLDRRIATTLELARLKAENERLHRAIEDSQARLFNVYDSLDDVIMQVDHDCRVVSLNRSGAALANLEPKQAIGKVCWQLFDFFPCEQRTHREVCPIYRTFLEGETLRGVREDVKTKSVAQFMTFITTLHGEDYSVYRETDITEKRRLEERIAGALRTLGAGPTPEST